MMDMYGNYGLIHASCEDLNKCGEIDRGEFSEVVKRNSDLFPDFFKQFKATGVL